MEGHAEEYFWKRHLEKRPASLGQLSVDDTSSKIVEEIRDILHENEKMLPPILKDVLKQVVTRKKSERNLC